MYKHLFLEKVGNISLNLYFFSNLLVNFFIHINLMTIIVLLNTN